MTNNYTSITTIVTLALVFFVAFTVITSSWSSYTTVYQGTLTNMTVSPESLGGSEYIFQLDNKTIISCYTTGMVSMMTDASILNASKVQVGQYVIIKEECGVIDI